MSTAFSVKKQHGKEQNGRYVLIRKIWRFLSTGKNISMKAVGKKVNIFMNIFLYMKVFICFPVVPSSDKLFQHLSSVTVFFLNSACPVCSSGSEILFYSLPALHFIKYSSFSINNSALRARLEIA